MTLRQGSDKVLYIISEEIDGKDDDESARSTGGEVQSKVCRTMWGNTLCGRVRVVEYLLLLCASSSSSFIHTISFLFIVQSILFVFFFGFW